MTESSQKGVFLAWREMEASANLLKSNLHRAAKQIQKSV